MLQSLINDFDSLSPGMQASLSELIHGIAIKQAIERANKANRKVVPFQEERKSSVNGRSKSDH